MGDWIRQCNVRLWKYHEPSLSFVLTLYSLSKDEITDERVCALVRELQVSQSHQKLEWVQPFMSDILRGACWDCTVIPIPVWNPDCSGHSHSCFVTGMHWNIREDLRAYSDTCKPCPIHLALYTCMDGCAHPDLWSRSNESLLSMANNLMCMYQSFIPMNIYKFMLLGFWFTLVHCCLNNS